MKPCWRKQGSHPERSSNEEGPLQTLQRPFCQQGRLLPDLCPFCRGGGQSLLTSRTSLWYTVSPESGSVRVTVTVSISLSSVPGVVSKVVCQL